MGRQLPPLCVCHGSPTPTSPSLSSLRCLNRTIHGVRKLAAWEDKILCAADASFGRRPQPTEEFFDVVAQSESESDGSVKNISDASRMDSNSGHSSDGSDGPRDQPQMHMFTA
ncbi:hypothetical protein SORBI_3005G128700 [Sorghum bicolor]|nr:hypothetical protein SORBI_3005G128700 [Sorghum bicolor]